MIYGGGGGLIYGEGGEGGGGEGRRGDVWIYLKIGIINIRQ